MNLCLLDASLACGLSVRADSGYRTGFNSLQRRSGKGRLFRWKGAGIALGKVLSCQLVGWALMASLDPSVGSKGHLTCVRNSGTRKDWKMPCEEAASINRSGRRCAPV